MQLQKNILSSEVNRNNDTTRLALVSVSVESSLLGHDIYAYQRVVELLNKKGCNMYDCYDYPDYLNEILKTLPGDLYYRVVKSIHKGLGEFSYIDGIPQFLDELK